MSQMNVQIVTPDGLVYDHHAAFVSVKTIDGELGILPHHINTIAVLAVDQVKVRRVDDDKHIDWIAVNGGIIEVADNVITIVADSAERARDIDISRAERAKLRAEKAIEEAKDQHSVDMERRAKIALQPLTGLMSEIVYKIFKIRWRYVLTLFLLGENQKKKVRTKYGIIAV